MSVRVDMPERLFLASGGNATHPEGICKTPSERTAVATDLGNALLPLMEFNTELIITHGNGPAVGKILIWQSLARHRVEPMPFDMCVAHSQGSRPPNR